MSETKTTTFATGAKRSDPGVLPRYDLVPMESLRRLALIYHEGEQHYGKDNWRKGIPFSNLLNHAMEHLRRYKAGDHSEDQLAKVLWAFATMMALEESIPEMNDLGSAEVEA